MFSSHRCKSNISRLNLVTKQIYFFISGVPYTSGENVVKFLLQTFVDEMVKDALTLQDIFDNDVIAKLPLSDTTIARRVEDLSSTLEDEILSELRQSVRLLESD